jgi:CRP-like cAMP-binding protein
MRLLLRLCVLADCILIQRYLTLSELQVQSFAKGATIIKKGSVGTTLYFLDVGTARVETE